jgi:hypothetical protein
MISSVFGKTKPINYVLVLSFLFVLYVLLRGFSVDVLPGIAALPVNVLTLSALLLSALLVNFIVQRNGLTGSHGFAMFFFAVLYLYFPDTLMDGSAIVATLFFLLGMRRLISMQSLRNIKSKLFDATLWFLVSSLFLKWCVILLLLIFLYLYFYQPKQLRNWMVPFAALTVFVLIGSGVSALWGNSLGFLEYYISEWPGFRPMAFSWGYGIIFAAYLGVVVVAGVVSFLKLAKSGHGRLVSMRLLFITFLMTVALVILSGQSDSGVEMLTFFPAAVFLSRYVQIVKREPLRDTLLWAVLALGALLMLADWIIK